MGLESKSFEYPSINEKKGVFKLRDLLTTENSLLLLDLDDTIKEPKKYLWSIDNKERRLLPETVVAMRAVYDAGVKVGIATEQSFNEIKPFISDLAKLVFGSDNPSDLFSGISIAEGGAVINNDRILASKNAVRQTNELIDLVSQHLKTPDEKGWSILDGTDLETATRVKFPPADESPAATMSLWEKGKHVSESPEDEARYEQVRKIVEGYFVSLGLTSLQAFEAGNGTLRVTPRFISKSHTAELLGAFGIIALSTTVYACDGPNDVKLSQKIKSKGGGVIVVSNAVADLHKLADYSASMPSGQGFAEAISKIFPIQYQNAQSQFSQELLRIVE